MKLLLEYKMDHKPIAWKRAGRNGKRYFDTQAQIKRNLVKEFNILRPSFQALCEPIFVEFLFAFKQPKIKKKNYPISRPDLSNLIKFYEDCFNTVMWEDDSLIVGYLNSRKVYAPIYFTQIKIYSAHYFASDFYFE